METNFYVKKNDPKTGYLLIGKCNTSTPDPITQDLCENPDYDVSVTSIVPVANRKDHFRNQYCAMCNDGAVLDNLMPYETKIECEKPVALTYSKMQQIIKGDTRECNVTFKPPFFSEGWLCAPYQISTCNVTGLWQEYDESIELACESFVDTFNLTYKNMFCYLCNSNTDLLPYQMNCVNVSLDESSVSSINPPFLAILDLDSVSRELAHTKTVNCDVHTQFTDEKFVSQIQGCIKIDISGWGKVYKHSIVSHTSDQIMTIANNLRMLYVISR